MRSDETIRKAWESFERDVVPADAGFTQRREMKRSFYAGAHAMLHMVVHVGDDDVTEDNGVEVIKRLMNESDAFAFLVRKGQQ
jgi:hypothetical protein